MQYKIVRMEQLPPRRANGITGPTISQWIDVDIELITKEVAFGEVLNLHVSGEIMKRTIFDMRKEIDMWLQAHSKLVKKHLKMATQTLEIITNRANEIQKGNIDRYIK